jgi:hypothetical protein
MTRRRVVLAAIAVVAAFLAFLLRQSFHEAIVVPAAYLLWALGLYYHSVSQGVWWIILIVLVLLILGRSLMFSSRSPGKVVTRPRETRGQVEDLARWLGRASEGTYFKWLIANRLGKLAYQILVQRENGKARSVFEPLTGPDWEPGPHIQTYLQSGLQRSFADFPNPRKFLSQRLKTPLDADIGETVDFLESQVDST